MLLGSCRAFSWGGFMFNFKIKLAEKNISVDCIYESTVKFCKDYITEEGDSDISVAISPDDIAFEREKSDRERELEGLEPFTPSPAYLETLALYRKIADALIDFDTLLFHGSALSLDGDAFIFTAKSGTGKSTHTRLWREVYGDRVVMINDDKPLLRVTDGGVFVYGTPWCGKHNLGTNASAPLYAIVSLERSTDNRISESDARSLFPKLLSQTYRTKDPFRLQKTLALLDKMLKTVKVFELGCNMNTDAATVAYEGMKG